MTRSKAVVVTRAYDAVKSCLGFGRQKQESAFLALTSKPTNRLEGDGREFCLCLPAPPRPIFLSLRAQSRIVSFVVQVMARKLSYRWAKLV